MTKYGDYDAVLGSGYGHSMAHVHGKHGIDNSIDDARVIHEALPHGSGIDYTWHIMQLSTEARRFHCYNAYHAMTEHGFYCHVYDFRVTVDILAGGELKMGYLAMGYRELACCGYGLRDYLESTIWEACDIGLKVR